MMGYRSAAGKKLPGSTSVLKYVATMDSDILCSWAAKEARQGRDWRQTRQSAGDHGTLVHELCETKLPNALVDTDRPEGVSDEDWQKLQATYAAIREWYLKHEPKLVFAEEPLVSAAFNFGGTPDGVVVFPRDIPEYKVKAGDPWLLDYKTGSMVGAKEVGQMASYRQLLAEAKDIRVEGAILIHAPTKTPGYMRPVILDRDCLNDGWDLFRAGLCIGDIVPRLAAACE
jgi:hypothetical protein